MNNNIKNNISYILDVSIKNKGKFYAGVFFSLLSAIVSLLIPLILGSVLDILTKMEGNMRVEKVLGAMVIFIIIYTLQGMASYVLGKMGVEAMKNLQSIYNEHIVYLELKESNKYASGDIASRATNDISEVSTIVTVIIPNIVKNTIIVLCTIIILWLMNSKLTIFIIIMLLLLLVASKPVNSKLENLYKIHQSVLGDISAEVTRCISNMVVIKSFVGEKNECKNINILVEKLKNNMIKIVKNETIWNVFLSCALMCDMVIVISYAKAGFVSEIVGQNALSVYILYMIQLLSPAIDLVNSITEFVESNGAFQRIVEVLSLPKEKSVDLEEVNITNGNIRFSCVNFCYEGMRKVLNDITLEIPAKSMVAIIGPSGVGKTTLFSLILKLYKNYDGVIEIDAKDIKKLSINSIRTKIAYVSQNNIVVNGTVMDNLRYGKNNYMKPKEVMKILNDHQMLELFDDFPEGLYTNIGENGNMLSEGQKQRINIARAIISNPIIMLLDEITSNLDSKTEHEIMGVIEKQRGKSTVVMIAHRLNTVVNSDLIYMLNTEGKIECCGTHKYLLEHSTTYRKLILTL